MNKERRWDIARNHTATHLLQMALRQLLGKHIHQRGSLVTPERLRFDFPHPTALTTAEIQQLTHIINARIRQNLKVSTKETSYKEALASGAIALFNEKYGDMVRVVSIGSPPISVELCGGTHVASTGEIGLFLIISDSSIGAGLRRIEAVTGRAGEELIHQQSLSLHKICNFLGTTPENISGKVTELVTELGRQRRQVMVLEQELSKQVAMSLLSQVAEVGGVKIVAARVPAYHQEALREMTDILRQQLGSAVIVLGTIYNDRPFFLAAITPDLVGKGYHAGRLVNQVAKIAGGGGGGKARFAQAGGRDKSKLDEALQSVSSQFQV